MVKSKHIKLPFEEIANQISTQIDQHKGKWRLTAVLWEDCRQMILTKVWLKYDQFDPQKGELSHWLSPVIVNALRNIYRDNHACFSRPCIQGCQWNLGGDNCEKTSTGKQCSECPIYRDWEQRKLSHFNVKQTLPLDNHGQDVSSQQSDFLDINGAKQVIDGEMKKRLTKQEWKIYKMIYIQGKCEKEAGKTLGLKKSKHKMGPGYLQVLGMKKIFVETAKEIIEQHNLA